MSCLLGRYFQYWMGKLKGPDLFSGSIGKQLQSNQSAWCVVELDKILNSNFPVSDQETIDDLNFDQYYAY